MIPILAEIQWSESAVGILGFIVAAIALDMIRKS